MSSIKASFFNTKYVGQVASWVLIGVFVLFYKVILPRYIESPVWENSTVFGVGVALSWIVGRLVGKMVLEKKRIGAFLVK
ncbi:hypothetical protein [Glaciimonas sp. PCH181]|uniref:hypothetical protein n=1 Tax=Glaciimonas sp. PCH181 TaxID=2133943 RepID=UPI000D39C549|nr:hypothetical protein [Glaciimonas sp. PCH181]PUA20019.1 hypothetical protein C7W93_09520 [Glaciimonas sp. PCH181]